MWNGRFYRTYDCSSGNLTKFVFDVINSAVENFMLIAIILALDFLLVQNKIQVVLSHCNFSTSWLSSFTEIGKTVLWVSGSELLRTAVLDLVWLSLIFKQKRFSLYLLLLTIPLAFLSGQEMRIPPQQLLLVGLFPFMIGL